tara:strand:+ start:15121 stop:15420 length:300 start_codon:yes stop_codon:yes gene_type:complete
MLFTPLNKHLLIEEIEIEEDEESLIALPEEYKQNTGSRYVMVRFLSCADDCALIYDNLFNIEKEILLAVDGSMIEEVIIDNNLFLIIHQNHVVGVVEGS